MPEPSGEQDNQQQPQAPPPARPPARRPSAIRTIIAIQCWGYLALLLALWAFLRLEGDRWWPATILLFGTRWPWVAPLAILLPLAALFRRRSLWVLLLAAIVAAWPIMGLCVPWHRLSNGKALHPPLRVLTCNTQSRSLNVDALKRTIADARPDIVALQECTLDTAKALFTGTDWHVLQYDELCLASRHPIRPMARLAISVPGIAVSFSIDVPGQPIAFINLHLASPHPAFDAMLQGKPEGSRQVQQNSAARLDQSRLLRQYVAKLDVPVLLAGDFNSPPEGAVYRQSWAGFCNAFSSAGWGFGYSYRHGKRSQVRIDHILGSAGWQCTSARLGPDVGSRHRPLIADMEWTGK